MRELVWMCEGNQRVEWNRTAALMVTIIAIVSGKIQDPDDFNPIAKKHAEPPEATPVVSKVSLDQFMMVATGGKHGGTPS